MKFIICFLLLSVSAFADCILCIEGGGSKTILQAIDENGELLTLSQNGVAADTIEASGSNINTIGKEGLRKVFQSLFDNLKIGGEDFTEIAPSCQLIAGMAGLSLQENKEIAASLFAEWGLHQARLFSDAELALQLIEGDGVVLICGTGSICFGKKGCLRYRVGGLGKVLGDEGSGYQIGLQAVKAALEEEYGYGPATRLTPALRDFFQAADLKPLLRLINSGEIPNTKIAAIAPIVFELASENDPAASAIIDRTASDLAHLLSIMVKNSGLADGEVHLWGGVFKSRHAGVFIQKIFAGQPRLKPLNRAHVNPAVLFAKLSMR